MQRVTDQYFAGLPAIELVRALEEYREDWRGLVGDDASGISLAWTRNLFFYYHNITQNEDWTTALQFAGEQGELVKMFVPQARILQNQFLGMVTKQRLSFKAIAMQSDYAVRADSRLANGVCEHLVEDQRMDLKREQVAEHAGVLGQGFYFPEFRTDRGELLLGDERHEFAGKLVIHTLDPYQVKWDARYLLEDAPWVLIEMEESRWDLIAQYPRLKDAIMCAPSADEEIRDSEGGASDLQRMSHDRVLVRKFFHRPSPAMKFGRMTYYLSEDAVFEDDYNEYDELPIVPCRPETIHRTGFGYPSFSNLIPLQEMLNHSFSIFASNQHAFGIQSLCVPNGAPLDVQDVMGMKFIRYQVQQAPGGGKPEPLQLTKSPPETMPFLDKLSFHMEQVAQLNSAMRGNPPAGATSGVAIATLSANAMELTQRFAKADQIALEMTMGLAMRVIARKVKLPQLISMVGRHKQHLAKTFVGKDVENVSKVKMRTQNPLMSTSAGRLEVAGQLLGKKPGFTEEKFLALLEDGSLDRFERDTLNEDDLIAMENDDLMYGDAEVLGYWSDDHAKHYYEHMAQLNDPETRRNSDAVERIQAHADWHLDMLEVVDPRAYAIVRTGMVPELPPGGMDPGMDPGMEMEPEVPEDPGMIEGEVIEEGGPMGPDDGAEMGPATPAMAQLGGM